MISTDTKDLEVEVTRVLVPREEFSDGRERWTVMLTKQCKCCGMLAFYPKAGTRLKLTGHAEAYHGELNFRFSKVRHNAPMDKHALLIYASELSKGVGPKAVEAIWGAYGADWEKHLDDMNQKWALPLTRTLNELHANEDRLALIAYLIGIGGTPKMAELAFTAWGKNAAATIENDPFVLCTLPGIGFKTVDGRVREHFGVGNGDVRRAKSAILYAVAQVMEENGNSVVPAATVYGELRGLSVPQDVATRAMAALVDYGKIEYVGLDRLTTRDVVKHESDIARYVAQKTMTDVSMPMWEGTNGLDESQNAAVEHAVRCNGLTVINGGAGCGKTTIIRHIASHLEAHGSAVLLCAFAGKAAARLREATGHSASTIHSMLGWRGDGLGFANQNLHGRTVIVDEASMVPSSLLYEITKRDPERLILVGDQAQLQPVGIGSPFHDAIDCLEKVVHTLTTCYRNKEAVFCAADRIRNGRMPESAKSKDEKFILARMKNAQAIHDCILEMVRAGDIDFQQDIVLAPRNGEGEDPAPCTVKSLNADIQAIVNPHGEKEKFRVGDRVMCTKNFAAKDMWNGTTGTVSRIDIDGRPWVRTDEGDEVHVTDKEMVAALVPAWCLTVHKSQGSQYRNVLVCCLNRDVGRLMDRSMLYTAVTRARRSCTLFCDCGLNGVLDAVHRRKTYLQAMMNGDV